MDKYIFNTTQKEIQSKKYNIFIGISLGGLKPLTEELAEEYISWALKNTKEKVIILVADVIAKFNYKIFSKYSEGKSLKNAIKEGDKYEIFFERVISKFSKKDQSNIIILRWKDIWSKRLCKIKNKLDDQYVSNDNFKRIVLSFVEKYAEKRKKKLDDKKLDYLSQYILSELPTLLDGVKYESKKYSLLVYPTFAHSGMSDFITKIEKGAIFPALKKSLNLDRSVAIVEFHLPVIN